MFIVADLEELLEIWLGQCGGAENMQEVFGVSW